MATRKLQGSFPQPMRIQARPGSHAERVYFDRSTLPGRAWPAPKVLAPGIDPAPLSDLIFHGGKTVAQMEFQNIYLGSAKDWNDSDPKLIDAAITRAMQDKRLNNVMRQYFPGASLSCDPRASLKLNEARPTELGEPQVQAKVIQLYDAGKIARTDLGSTIFNLILPAGTLLRLDASTSLRGLGGYHGSVHFKRGGRSITLYYSASVYSQRLSPTRENGIAVWKQSWKNVVATLYHELNEFRTDADVNDAIIHEENDFLGWTSRDGLECGDQPIAAADPLTEVFRLVGARKTPVQFMFSNAVHGAEGPIAKPH